VTALGTEYLDMGMPASFVWDYDDRRPRLQRLYEKSKVSQWNAATDLDWSIDVDPGKVSEQVQERFSDAQFDFESRAVGRFALASDENRWLFEAHSHAWTVSQFMHGEQGALVATAKIAAGATSIDDKYYAAAQVADEARHVEAYQRYLGKIDITYPVSGPLHGLLDEIISHRHLDMTFLGMQILVEGVALAAFSLGGVMFGNELISRITELVRRDEARHVAFGVLSLSGFYDEMDPVDMAEREDFVLEACSLMRDRFVSTEVYERLGIDVGQATQEWQTSPDAAAFRSLMFSKVVPNLSKLGLLTPKVRAGFEQLGILRYERYVDSATEAGELEPGEGHTPDDPIAALRAGLGGLERVPPGPVLQVLSANIDPTLLKDTPTTTIRLDVSGIDDGDWLIKIDRGTVEAASRPAEDTTPVDVTIGMDVATWTDIVAGRLTAPAAAMDGRIRLEGDVMRALALEAML